jgi:hypothetical protein
VWVGIGISVVLLVWKYPADNSGTASANTSTFPPVYGTIVDGVQCSVVGINIKTRSEWDYVVRTRVQIRNVTNTAHCIVFVPKWMKQMHKGQKGKIAVSYPRSPTYGWMTWGDWQVPQGIDRKSLTVGAGAVETVEIVQVLDKKWILENAFSGQRCRLEGAFNDGGTWAGPVFSQTLTFANMFGAAGINISPVSTQTGKNGEIVKEAR